MTTQLMKYTLQDFKDIIFDGFDYKLPEETVNLISELALEVGSPSYIKTPVFKKKEPPLLKGLGVEEPWKALGGSTSTSTSTSTTGPGGFSSLGNRNNNKRRGNKGMEIVNDEDWESLRAFQTTVIEQKVGIDVQIDLIRSHLNKMSDKNYQDLKLKIMDVMESLVESDVGPENLLLVSSAIFDIASNNRFYSKLYADLYCDLIHNYEFLKEMFEKSFHSFLDIFEHIEYVDADKDYDLFCKINKNNEKRKALSAFFVNLTINGLITKTDLLNVIKQLLNNVLSFMAMENKKNEVDELTENIALLCNNKTILENRECVVCDGMTIEDIIRQLANSKSKTYPSLSNKSIFKYMDLIEM